MSDAFFDQASHALVLIKQKNPPKERLQALYDLGLFADLLDVDDPSAVDREEYRKLLGLPPLRLVIDIDYDNLDFEALVVAGHYDWRNDSLNERNFPVKGKGKKRFECKLLDAGCSSKDGVDRITTADKAHPWKPGETEHILAFGAAFPRLQLKHPIVGLGSTARVDGSVSVPCLGRRGAERGLGLAWWGLGWPAGWRLLGVREISDPAN